LIKKDLDLLVVGGGPAGLATAAAAAGGGASVLVVERESEIGRPVRTSGSLALKTILEFGIPSDLYHLPNTIRIVGPTQSAAFDCEGDGICVLDVTRFYKYLAVKAEEAGATVVTGVTANLLSKDGHTVGARLSDGENVWDQPARMLVDATGYRAALSKETGLHEGFKRFGVGVEYEMIAPHYEQDDLLFIVGSRIAPKGYAWAFPWGEGRVRVGVGLLHGDTRANPATHLKMLMEECDSFGIDLRDAEIVEEQRGLIPAEVLPPTFVGDGVLAVGDAAGQPTILAGEGIRMCLEAGARAGEVAAKALGNGDVSRKALLPYEKWFRRKHGFSLKMGHYLNRRMAKWEDSEWDRRIVMIRSMGGKNMAGFIQCKFDAFRSVGWLLRHPNMWRRVFRYGLMAVSHFFRR
jgi:digeranylgeranylglycerophospholipid reductase